MDSFFKDNKKVSSQIIRHMAVENPRALTLWLGLKDIANGYGICVASQKSLEKLLHVRSRMTVYRAVNYLYSHGYIGLGKIGSQRAYILNPNITEMLVGDTSKDELANHGMTFCGVIHLTKEENPKLYKETRKFLKECPKSSMKYSINHIKNFHSSFQDRIKKRAENASRRTVFTSVPKGAWKKFKKNKKKVSQS